MRKKRQRRARSGQSMVEFALVVPVFFFIMLGMVDGGMLMFSQGAVNHAASLGSNSIASAGISELADFSSVELMGKTGFGNIGLINVGEVDIEGLQPDPVFGYAHNPDGTPMADPNHCPAVGSPPGAAGSSPCVNAYTLSVTNNVVTVRLMSGTGSAATVECKNVSSAPATTTCPGYATCKDSSGVTYPSGCPPWDPSIRDVTTNQSSYAALVIHYSFKSFSNIGPQLDFTTIKVLRLEPSTS